MCAECWHCASAMMRNTSSWWGGRRSFFLTTAFKGAVRVALLRRLLRILRLSQFLRPCQKDVGMLIVTRVSQPVLNHAPAKGKVLIDFTL